MMLQAELAASGSPCGSFGQVDGEPVFFYRWHGVLTFRWGQAQPIRLTDLITTKWNTNGKRGLFIIQKEQDVVFHRSFALNPNVLSMDNDPTAFAEAEDFDFLLFVHNVQSSSERRELIYR